MRKIGIIAAMEPEIELLCNSLEGMEEVNILGTKFYQGVINGHEVVLAQSGVGKVNAAMAATILLLEFGCNLLINTGIAGGIKPLKTKDVIIGSSLGYYDFDTTIFGYDYGQVPGMPKKFMTNPACIMLVKQILNKLNIEYKETTIYSGDQFVSSFEQLKNISNLEGIACEMEGAAVAHVAVKAGIDFIILRYISDIVGEESQVNDYLAFESEMANRSANICLQIMNNIE